MDTIGKIGHSTIQHGKDNDRIYLMKLAEKEPVDLIQQLDHLASANSYSKIIAKVPESAQPYFLINNYRQEAYIPQFYKGNEGAFFMAKYFDQARAILKTDSLLNLAGALSVSKNNNEILPERFTIQIMKARHTIEMANVYQQVFETYPFPITDASYLEKTMQDGSIIYYGIWDNQKLIGLSSAELDRSNLNAEMTDFAVLPAYRGLKLASFLLKEMEKKMEELDFKTLYTISRLNSPGITKTFINNEYHYSGLLINNTNISGKIENMNVFYKSI